MRISIIARDRETCTAGLSYFTCKGYRGCCHLNPCPGTDCPRLLPKTQPSETVASVAAPLLVSATNLSSSRKPPVTITIHNKSQSTGGVTTTSFMSDSTGPGGAWYTDPKGRPISTISSLGPSLYPAITSAPTASATPIESEVLVTSTVAPQSESERNGLPTAAQAGIAVSVLIVLVAVIAAYFLCTKQRKELRASRESISSISRYGSKHGSEEDQSKPSMTTSPFQSEEGFSPFGGRYEEPQTRFNRVSDIGSGRMMNHPVNPDTRDSVVPQPPSTVIARAATASPDFIPRTANATPDFTCRTANATPDFMSRLGTATPELHGPPQQAAIAELASPGLPKVVEIYSSRTGAQTYKPYRLNGSSLYPVAETTPSYLNGTLNATRYERSEGRYVNSWSKWEPAA